MAKKQSDAPPPPLVVKTEKGIRPLRAWDAEDIAEHPFGTVYELHISTKRSHKQLRTFWKALGIVRDATDICPTKEKLCEELKFDLGYREKFKDWKTGEIHERADSIAIAKMKPEIFNKFFSDAMMRLAQVTGIDPLSFLESQE